MATVIGELYTQIASVFFKADRLITVAEAANEA